MGRKPREASPENWEARGPAEPPVEGEEHEDSEEGEEDELEEEL